VTQKWLPHAASSVSFVETELKLLREWGFLRCDFGESATDVLGLRSAEGPEVLYEAEERGKDCGVDKGVDAISAVIDMG
jgi:hypothetical protein